MNPTIVTAFSQPSVNPF